MHRQCLADPRFCKQLPDSTDPLYCALVEDDGTFQLVVVTNRGRKIVREATLTLDDILENLNQRKNR